jgi:hypothetical protein
VSDRVAGRGLPQILPITYGMDRGSVYFRALPDCLLAELVEPTSVALEVDELNQQTRSGWNIVLHGHRSAVREPCSSAPVPTDCRPDRATADLTAGHVEVFVRRGQLNRSFRWVRPVISRSSYGAFMLQGPVLIALAITLRPLQRLRCRTYALPSEGVDDASPVPLR